MKLDFVVPGFSKCGTTTLCSLLCDHPDIFIPEIKEPNFFAAHYCDDGWSWYEKLFEDARESQLWGDGSTMYSADEFAEDACKRVLEHYPDIRFIFIARNPVKRLESSFREFLHSGYRYGVRTPHEINDALTTLPNMVADSRYWTLINRYRAHVPDSRIHVLFLEDFKQDPERELRRCFRFLGVDAEVPVPDIGRQLNSAATKYYDTKVLQFIHRTPWMSRLWWKMNCSRQDKWGRRLGLRRPITRPVAWSEETRRMLYDELGGEIERFLDFYGKPRDFWRFASWAGADPLPVRAAPLERSPERISRRKSA